MFFHKLNLKEIKERRASQNARSKWASHIFGCLPLAFLFFIIDMLDIKDFKEIPSITWSFVVMLVIGTIIPGILLIFLFREDLFISVESVKLLFLSMGIALPVWVCNTILIIITVSNESKSNNEEEKKMELQISGILGAGISILPLFLPALVQLFYPICANIGFYIGFGVEMVIVACFIYGFIKK